jgi:PAS domain S-box-containing protein
MSGKIDMVNSRAEQMFGYPRDEMLGKPVEMLVPDGKRGECRAFRATFMNDPRPRSVGQEVELCGLRRDGTEFPVEISLSPIEIDGQLVICAGIRDQTENKRLEARLMAAERERGDTMRDLAAFVQGAQEEERQRVARELHDDLGQRLAALKLNMQVFEQEVSPRSDAYRARLHTLVTDVDRMIAEVRRLSYNLRPLALDDFGLTVALEMLCKDFERVYKVRTRLYVGETLPQYRAPQVDIALYRIAQGALSNVARHADAHHVMMRLVNGNQSVGLSIEDDGRGFDAKSPGRKRDARSGLGLMGMRERSELLGGLFHIESQIYEGTKVEVRIPVSAVAGEESAHS